MRFAVTLLSFPLLTVAYFQFSLLNQFNWKWLLVAFFIYCLLLLRFLALAVDSPRKYGFDGTSSGGGGMDSDGDYFDSGESGGGDCGGGGGGGD